MFSPSVILAATKLEILIQIMTNPVAGEYDEYISSMVRSKILQGEFDVNSNSHIKYKSFTALNMLGAYSFQQGRFYWNKGEDYLFMLAFNVSTLNEAQMAAAATQLIEQIEFNFNSKF